MAKDSSLLKVLKEKAGWDTWRDWHPKTQLLIKLFPLILIAFAIPLTVGFLQQRQNLNQDANSTCITSTTSFQTAPITPQTGAFEAQFDVTPSTSSIDWDIGFSSIPAQAYKDMAVIVEFNSSGNITARNGGSYQAVNTIQYNQGTTYHFRLTIDIPNHKYNVYVTPAGGTEQTVGTNFAFRSEQASVTNLLYWNIVGTKETSTVCNMTIISPPPVCLSSNSVLSGQSIPSQTGAFEAQFDSTPNANNTDADTGFSQKLASAYTDMAVIVEFNKQGKITARNGGSYQAVESIPYVSGTVYHFRIDVNIPKHIFNAYVSSIGMSEKTIATNFAFRSEQAGISSISYWNIVSTNASHTVCNLSITSAVSPTPTGVSLSPIPTSQPTLTPTPVASGQTGIYGVGVSGDTRNNHQIGTSSHYKVDYRFRATTSSIPSTITVSERGKGGYNTYSGGNGGTIRATIQTDNAAGLPSGTVLATTQWNPGNPSGNWEVWPIHTLSGASTLNKGQLYHIVFENVSSDPNNNWISLNALYTYGQPASKPIFGNDYALLQAAPSAWSLQAGDIPIFDLAYANGSHDGMNYIGCMVDLTYVGKISGSSNMVRETINVSGQDRLVSSVSVRVRRTSGSSPLVIRLEKADGTQIEEVTVPATSIAQSAAGLDNGGSVWATANFSSIHTLANGQSYNLVLKTSSDTEYTVAPIQEGRSKGMRSYAFTNGVAQRTTNAGSSWSGLYGSEADLQFYFK
ncbi:MAG TPA: hypothetical protein VES68_00670 [Candidatus Sulfotelmatobacter sp.]|nr:hypothetical protein [Candidatus Sulfotelmatobacter sp.]